MSKPFSLNTMRFDPYKSYAFLVYFGTNTSAVAGVSKITGLKRSSDGIRVQGRRERTHAQRPGANQVRADHSRAGRHPRYRFRSLGQRRPGSRQRRAFHVTEESSAGNSNRFSQRRTPAGVAIQRPSLLGVRVSGAAGSGRGVERNRHRAHQARKRRLGTRSLAAGSSGDVTRACFAFLSAGSP